MEPPAVGSLLDLFPKFPWNLPVIIIIALVFFHIAYFPFVLKNIIERFRNGESLLDGLTDEY
jgi:hypothetical protein